MGVVLEFPTLANTIPIPAGTTGFTGLTTGMQTQQILLSHIV
jgi:hypothetical protein